MAIKGNLREASLPDVLQLLSMGQKTGCLSLTDRSNFGYIYFERGRISYASIVNRRDRLGDLLVKNGLLDARDLFAAIDDQAKSPGERLGEILIRRGSITRDQLEHYIRIQIEEAVYFLFTWTQGSFYFEADQRPEEGSFQVSINPENLLLEGARRIDEWSLIEKKIPSLDLVFETDRTKPMDGLELSDDQRKIIPLMDGKRTVQELIEESGMVEFDVGKALFGLIQAGFAHPVGRRSPTEQKEVPQARIDEHRNLGIAFYRTGMYDESTREFRRVAELQPQNVDSRFHLALIGLRKGDDRMALRFFKETTEMAGRGPRCCTGCRSRWSGWAASPTRASPPTRRRGWPRSVRRCSSRAPSCCSSRARRTRLPRSSRASARASPERAFPPPTSPSPCWPRPHPGGRTRR
jgi:tetratricopeptide (TPR) repeat protein